MILSKISFLIIAGFSFLIFIFTVSCSKSNISVKVYGNAFFIPLFLSVFSFLFLQESSFSSVFLISEILLVLPILMLTIFNINEKAKHLIQFLYFLIPVLLSFVLYRYNTIPYFPLSAQIQIIILFILVLLILIIIRNKKEIKKILFTGLLFLFLSYFIKTFAKNDYILFISILFKFASYLSFYISFYNTSYNHLMGIVSEAKKLKNKLDKSLYHEVKKRTLDIELSNERLLKMSKKDSLTGAYNKKAILNYIENLIKSKSKKKFSILMIDLDDFKGINDKYGHLQGDECLKNFSRIAKDSIRKVDYLGRFGGDEFIIVLPSLSDSETMFVAERFIKNINNIKDIKFAVSIGIASYPDDANTVKEIISIADRGVYLSKEKAGNSISHEDIK